MSKPVLLPFLVGLACVMAAVYGALHNQISYSVGPDYFHALKFPQFGIAPALPYRAGAALVGVYASWWMGWVIGLPIAAVCLRARDAGAMVAVFLGAAALVMGLTLGLGLLSLLVPIAPEAAASFPMPSAVQDPVAFARAALMHEISYGAGLFGLLVGLIYAWRKTRR